MIRRLAWAGAPLCALATSLLASTALAQTQTPYAAPVDGQGNLARPLPQLQSDGAPIEGATATLPGGLTSTSITQTGGIATATFASAPGLAAGSPFAVTGAVPSGYNVAGAEVISASGNTITYAVPSGTASPATSQGTFAPASQPWSQTGFSSSVYTLSGTWTGTVTFRTSPLLDNATWLTNLSCTALSGTLTSGTMTGNGVVSCPAGGAPQDVAFTTPTSGSVTVTASKFGASAAQGFPFEASPAAWNATVISNDYAGLSVPVRLMTEVYSTVSGEPGYNGLGVCSIVTDTGSSSGAATWYARTTPNGSFSSYTPSSNINPWSCVGGSLQFLEQYDSTNARWIAGRISSNDTNFTQADGFSAPPYDFYAEVELTSPPTASLPSGFTPWLAPIWITDSNNQPFNTTNAISLTSSLQGHDEFDPCETGIANTVPGGAQLYSQCIFHHHEFGPNNDLGAEQPGLVNGQRFIASGVYNYAGADGAKHKYGIYKSKNFVCAATDRVIGYCELIPGSKPNYGMYQILIDFGPSGSPTASHTATIPFTVGSLRVYTWTGAGILPIPQLQ